MVSFKEYTSDSEANEDPSSPSDIDSEQNQDDAAVIELKKKY